MQPGMGATGGRTAQCASKTTGERARGTARVSAAAEKAAGRAAAEPAPGTAGGRTAARRSQPQTASSADETGAPDDIMNTRKADNRATAATIRGSVINVRFSQRLPDINHLIEIGEK